MKYLVLVLAFCAYDSTDPLCIYPPDPTAKEKFEYQLRQERIQGEDPTLKEQREYQKRQQRIKCEDHPEKCNEEQ